MATILLDAYGDESRRLYEWFLNWDVQYASDISSVRQAQGSAMFCSAILTDMCIEALEGRIAEVPMGGFPFNGLKDYRERGGGELTCWDPIAVAAVYASLVNGYELSVRVYGERVGSR